MDLNIANRLKLYIESKGLSNSQFADICGIPRPSLSQIITGRNKKVSNTLVSQIHQAFPDLSVMWLMSGEGPISASASAKSAISEDNQELRASEIPESAYDQSTDCEFSNDSALNSAKKLHNIAENKLIESDIKMRELKAQIEKMRQNPRKVVQITIYYDDSTFETFIPGQL